MALLMGSSGYFLYAHPPLKQLSVSYYVCVNKAQYEKRNPPVGNNEGEDSPALSVEEKAQLDEIQKINKSCVDGYVDVSGNQGVRVSNVVNTSKKQQDNEIEWLTGELKGLDSYTCVIAVDWNALMKQQDQNEASPPPPLPPYSLSDIKSYKEFMLKFMLKPLRATVSIPNFSDHPAPAGNLILPEVKSDSRCKGGYTEHPGVLQKLIPEGYYLDLTWEPAPKGRPPLIEN